MSHKYKEVYAASAEVLGMVLAYMQEKEEVSACLLLSSLLISIFSTGYLFI